MTVMTPGETREYEYLKRLAHLNKRAKRLTSEIARSVNDRDRDSLLDQLERTNGQLRLLDAPRKERTG